MTITFTLYTLFKKNHMVLLVDDSNHYQDYLPNVYLGLFDFVIDDLPVTYSPVVGGEYYNTAGTVPYTQYQTAAYPADPAWTMRYTNPTGILSKSLSIWAYSADYLTICIMLKTQVHVAVYIE